MVLNISATLGCLIGVLIGYAIAGPDVFIPFLLAILLYNHPDTTTVF